MTRHRFTDLKPKRARFRAAVGEHVLECDSFADTVNWFEKVIGEAIRNRENPDISFVCTEPYHNFWKFPWGVMNKHAWRVALEEEAAESGIRDR